MYKVRCRLITFEGDAEKFPCHFHYEIGDEFYYDGVHFTGRICPGLFASMFPIIHGVFLSGHKFSENIMYRYRGPDMIDPEMKKYDGVGWRVLKELPAGALPQHLKVLSPKPSTELQGGWGFVCADSRTSAYFFAEAYDLADLGDSTPYYHREMAILDKIKAKPGITVKEVLSDFTDWERDEIYPPLTMLNTQLFMDELASVGYIEYRDGKAYSKTNDPAK